MINTPDIKVYQLFYHQIVHYQGLYEDDDDKLSAYKSFSPCTKHQRSMMILEYPKNSEGVYHAGVWDGGYKRKSLSG